jgi:hypothetical protein
LFYPVQFRGGQCVAPARTGGRGRIM